MDKFDRNRGGDTYNNSGEEPHSYNSGGRHSRGGGAPFHHRPQENYRVGGGGRDSPHSYRGGFSSGGARGSGGGGRDNQRPFDSPPAYPSPPSGIGGIGGGGLRSGGDGIGGFRPMVGGMEGFGPTGGGGGRGFRPMGGGGEGFGPMGGGDGGGFRLMGGGANGFQPMGDGGGEGGRFPPIGGGGSDAGRFPPLGGIGGDGGGFRRLPGGDRDAGGFQSVGGGDDGSIGLNNYHMPPPTLTGQKRGYPFPGRERSPGKEGASFAKLFVGSVPRTAIEDDIRPLFEKHGSVLEVALIKDKRTGQQQGCCFIKYASSDEADRAIAALHNQYTLPGAAGPIQVRYADGERERLGATEYKLFVGSLSKQATEKDVEEIFLPYGKVQDVYLMRDEMKQSRGCGFVKYYQRDMAQAAINSLNGIYTMRGCDQPLTVRFADPKRPRPGDSRGGLSLGGPGIGPRFAAPGIRPPLDHHEPFRGPTPNSWHTPTPQNLGPPSHVGNHGFGNQFPPRSGGEMTISSTSGPVGVRPGSADGSFPPPTVSSTPMPQMNFNQPLPQVPSFGSKISPVQRPLQSPQQLPPAQLQPLNAASFSNVHGLQGTHTQPGQMQTSHSARQTSYGQASSAQQLPGQNGQLSVPQNQVQHSASSAHGQAPGMANQQHSQQLQPHSQSPSGLAQMLSHQKQTLQATFQSSQQALNQLQQQLQQLQPANQNITPQQGQLTAKQQSPWAGTLSQPVASTPGNNQPTGNLAATTTASPAVPATCNWSEHMSPDGYKYYYNSLTGESKWEKPEELTLYEQQQQQKPSNQNPQVQSHPSGPSIQQAPQMQVQFQSHHQAQSHNQNKQFQQTAQSSYQVPAFSAKQGTKDLGYAQVPTVTGQAIDPSRYQQGVQASQEWMWKNRHSGM
ncbi:hypothetical protein ACS0TY_027727 [Phlomoides rotata]